MNMKQTEHLEVSRLRGGTIIKLIVIGSIIGCTLFATLAGAIGLFGVELLQWNGQYLTGVKGLVASPFVGAFIGMIFGGIVSATTYIGLRFFALFSSLSIEYLPAHQSPRSTENAAD